MVYVGQRIKNVCCVGAGYVVRIPFPSPLGIGVYETIKGKLPSELKAKDNRRVTNAHKF